MASWITDQLMHIPPQIAELCYCQLTDAACHAKPIGPYAQDTRNRTQNTVNHEFSGNAGLLTKNGIPKPSFCALSMLQTLGCELLAQGSGYALTKQGYSLRLLLYNYSYFSESYLTGKQELLFEDDRYNIYAGSMDKLFHLQISLPKDTYCIESIQIDRTHGSPYDAWICMGKPDMIHPLYHKYLKSRNFPDIHTEKMKVVSSYLHLEYTIPIHSVLVVRIDPEIP